MTEEEALNYIIRNDLYSFIKKVFYEVTGGEDFIESWHIELICDILEQCRSGKIKRLIINVPPRSLKSIITTVGFSSWLLGHNPTEKVISVGYSSELSERAHGLKEHFQKRGSHEGGTQLMILIPPPEEVGFLLL